MKVRRPRPGRLTLLAIPMLLVSSMGVAAALGDSHQTPTLTSSVFPLVASRASLGDVEGGPDQAPAWVADANSPEQVRANRAGSSGQPARIGPGRIVGVTITIGRREPRAVVTNALTVGQLLEAMRVSMGDSDAVRPGGYAPLLEGQQVQVIRIRRVHETVSVEVPFTTLIQYSKDMDLGQRTVLKPGAPGKMIRTYEVTYRNGMEVRRILLEEESLAAPVPQVEIRGTRIAPAGPPSGAHSECGIASWYAGRTAGMVAAHKTLPFGTRVTVRDQDNGRTVTVVINDRGPYITGRIIDLSNEAFAVLAPLGQGTARVCISW